MSRFGMQRIEHVLMMHWDPIGVSDAPKAADEYRDYAAAIEAMILRGTTASQIAQYLLAAEHEEMNLPGDPHRAQATAQALLALR